jgi:hypothetical protein
VGWLSHNLVILTSDNGSTWTENTGTWFDTWKTGKGVTNADLAWVYLYDVVWDGSQYIVAGALAYKESDMAPSKRSGIVLFGNGSTWDIKLEVPATGSTIPSFYSVAYGNNTYVAGRENGTLYYSTDAGANWNSVSMLPNTNDINDIIFENGKFIAVGWNGQIRSSTDGITWSQMASNPLPRIWGVAFGANRYVVIGRSSSNNNNPGIAYSDEVTN